MKKIKRNIILTPAPATTTDTVKYAQVVPDICPREKEFGELMNNIRQDLIKIIHGDKKYTSILFTASGTSIMDAVINSVIPKSGKLLILENGAYGKRIEQIAEAYNIKYKTLKVKWGTSLDLKYLDEYLSCYCNAFSAVAVIHHETTTGILNDIEAIGKIVKKYKKVYIIDTISSFGGIPINIKKIKADYIMGSANKCLQGMPGISFVIAKKSELKKIKNYSVRSYYLNLWRNYEYFEKKKQTPFTPAIQCIYALKQALKEYFKEGEGNRWKRYQKNWIILSIGMEELGFEPYLNFGLESRIVTTYYEPKSPYYKRKKFNFNKFHDKLKQKGFTIYPGKLTDEKTFRLGNIGDITRKDIKKFLKAVKKVKNDCFIS